MGDFKRMHVGAVLLPQDSKEHKELIQQRVEYIELMSARLEASGRARELQVLTLYRKPTDLTIALPSRTLFRLHACLPAYSSPYRFSYWPAFSYVRLHCFSLLCFSLLFFSLLCFALL